MAELDIKLSDQPTMTEKFKYRFKLESQLSVEAESRDSALLMAYEILASLKLGTRKNPMLLEGIRIKTS